MHPERSGRALAPSPATPTAQRMSPESPKNRRPGISVLEKAGRRNHPAVLPHSLVGAEVGEGTLNDCPCDELAVCAMHPDFFRRPKSFVFLLDQRGARLFDLRKPNDGRVPGCIRTRGRDVVNDGAESFEFWEK